MMRWRLTAVQAPRDPTGLGVHLRIVLVSVLRIERKFDTPFLDFDQINEATRSTMVTRVGIRIRHFSSNCDTGPLDIDEVTSFKFASDAATCFFCDSTRLMLQQILCVAHFS